MNCFFKGILIMACFFSVAAFAQREVDPPGEYLRDLKRSQPQKYQGQTYEEKVDEQYKIKESIMEFLTNKYHNSPEKRSLLDERIKQFIVKKAKEGISKAAVKRVLTVIAKEVGVSAPLRISGLVNVFWPIETAGPEYDEAQPGDRDNLFIPHEHVSDKHENSSDKGTMEKDKNGNYGDKSWGPLKAR